MNETNEHNPDRPIVVCLCGSSKWPDIHMRAMMDETLAGRIVIPMGLYGHADFPRGAKVATNDGDESTAVKQMLDTLHHRKIDAADEILVLTVGGYIGSSTKREIEYAKATGKKVRFLDCGGEQPSEMDSLRARIAELERGEQILWNQLAERDEVNAQLRARIAELERRVEELTEENEAFSKRAVELTNHLLATDRDMLERIVARHNNSTEIAKAFVSQLRAEVERLTKERDAGERVDEDYLKSIANLESLVATLQRERDEARAARDTWAYKWQNDGLLNLGTIDQLRAQLAEREEDRKDLDWLDRQGKYSCSNDFRVWAIQKRGEESTLRAAIRAARAQPEGGK